MSAGEKWKLSPTAKARLRGAPPIARRTSPPASSPSTAHSLFRAYARREELQAARASIDDPPKRDAIKPASRHATSASTPSTTRSRRLEQDHGGPLTAQQRAELENT
jgi:hypothetical protein